jgi:uncharacterized protein YjbI with pentapeptide repeats
MEEGTEGIFISYRRGNAAYAGWLAETLENHFGEQNVFRDIGSIAPGEDFVKAIERALEASVVMIVVVGRNWARELKEHEQRGQEDYTRLEITTVLDRNNVQVIPVLVQGAAMPRANELPSDLAALARRHAIELHDTNWQSDIQRLITVLEETVTRRRQPTGNRSSIEKRREQDAALQAYLEQLRQEVREGLRDEDPLSPIRKLTRGRTLHLLRQFDSEYKRYLLQILHEMGLIGKGTPVIGLSGADLREAYLRELDLIDADLRGADMKGANLEEVNLAGADLRGADLRGANLTNAYLDGVDLYDANLSNTNLIDARGLTNEGLEQQPPLSLEGATMPDGSEHP